MATITVLDPNRTAAALSDRSEVTKIVASLTPVVDTNQSVFVEGVTEPIMNRVRDRMRERGVKVTVRKVDLDGQPGYVLLAVTKA